MAEGALGISTGIGQGEAQIIKPFQSPVTAQQYGSVMAAQQKAKADKRSKTLANIETLDFKGMPNEAGLFSKAYNEIVEFVANADLNDPYIDIQMKQKISDLKTRANMSYDRKMAVNNIVGDVQKGEGKNIYLGIDDALQSAVADIDYNTFSNTEAYGKVNAERMAKLSGVKTIPIYDVGAAKASLLNQVGKWADINTQGRISETPDNVIDSYVEAELMGHPNAYATFEKLMKNDPVGAKAANNQVDKYAFNALRKDLKAKSFTVGSDTNVNVNVGGGDTKDTTPFAQYSKQTIPLGMKSTDEANPVPFETFVIQLPSKGVELGGGLVNTDMYMVKPNGETVRLRGQSAPTLSYTQIATLPIATKDIVVKGADGGKDFTIRKGQVVQPDYKRNAKLINGVDIPTENKVMAIAAGDNGSTYYRPVEDVARAIVNTFSGQKGLNYKGNVVFNDINDYADFLNQNGIQVQGYEGTTTQPTQKTTGGTSQPSVKPTGGTKTTSGAKSSLFQMQPK
jgi:hypothetical protein